jgi:hypothetical protein
MFLNLTTTHPSYTQLGPLQDRLRLISVRLADGKYQNENGDIPAGQASLFEVLNVCYGIKDAITLKIEGKA